MYCDWCKFACAPDVNEAQLTRTFAGKVMIAGTATWVNLDPLDIGGYYVKVEISQDNGLWIATPIKWIGVILDSEEKRDGIQNVADEVGKQRWMCRGLEFLLQRKNIDSSFVFKPGGSEVEIGRAIGFNLGAGRGNESHRKANRDAADGTKGTKIFAEAIGEGDGAQEWNAEQIVEYLLAYQFPTNAAGMVAFPLSFAGISTEILKTFKPTQETEGKTLYQVLNELIDRRRIMTWAIVPSLFGVELPSLQIYTFNSEGFTLPSGQFVPANPSQGEWYQDDDNTVDTFVISAEDATRVDQVIVRGEPLGACFTISDEDSALEPDWTPEQETLYNEGATTDADYLLFGPDDFDLMRDANQQVRNGPALEKVFRYFRVPSDWDGTINSEIVCPKPDDEDEATKFWHAGLRFQSKLPLLLESDYEDVEAITSEALTGSTPEYLRPFGVILDELTGRHYMVDRLPVGVWGTELEAGGRHWSVNVRMQDSQLGIILDVSGSNQHAIATADFAPEEDEIAQDILTNELDWRDIFVTVFAEFDECVEVREPATVTATSDTIRELIINVPNARLDYLVPGTVVDVDLAGDKVTTAGGYVRDDREKLEDIAKAAFNWYGQERRSLTAVVHNLVCTFNLGDLITLVGSAAVPVPSYTVITSLRFDLLAGTTTIQTQFAELDITAF